MGGGGRVALLELFEWLVVGGIPGCEMFEFES